MIKCIDTYYIMVGVAVTMVIPTMHEKSCIDLHNAGNLWFFKIKFSHSHISQSKWPNYEIIIDMGFLNYLNYRIQILAISYTTSNQNSFLKYNQSNWKLSPHDLQKQLVTLSNMLRPTFASNLMVLTKKMSPGMSKLTASLNGQLLAHLMRQNLHNETCLRP